VGSGGGKECSEIRLLDDERQQVASDDHESSGERLCTAPRASISKDEIRLRQAFGGEGKGLAIEIDADQCAIVRANRAHDGEQPSAAAAELKDRSTRVRRKIAPEGAVVVCAGIEVALIGEKPSADLGGDQRGASQRMRSPAALRFANALITSSAARFAIIAVDSAQSYGGETSTISIPAIGTREAICRNRPLRASSTTRSTNGGA
jgi:hypothetical protein